MMTLRYFKLSEFECPCCGENEIKTEFVERLDRARALADVPFRINSGYRCKEHNKAVGGKPSSSHLIGWASDIACLTSSARLKIVRALLDVGFDRIGVAKSFIHVDADPTKAPGVMWTY